jgi:lysozyme family protein
MSNFDTAIARVLSNEGGYTNPDPSVDPGGETNFGISKRAYPDLDIKNLTREQAVEIYRRDFWARVHGDDLPGPVAFQALDFAVNSGIETAVRKLQVAAGVADDGVWGPASDTAVRAANPAMLAVRLVAERLDYMRKLRNWAPNSAGWAARIAQDLRYLAQDAA